MKSIKFLLKLFLHDVPRYLLSDNVMQALINKIKFMNFDVLNRLIRILLRESG